MKPFYQKIILYFLICSTPILILLYLYLAIDPYNDLPYHYQNNIKYIYNSIGDKSTKKILELKKNKNCFIFGSSKSIYFRAVDCHKKIFKNDSNVRPFHYANFGESIGGIYNKLRLLNQLHFKTDYIFILLDGNLSFRETGSAQTYDHYLINKTSRINYYLNHFSEFFNPTSIYFKENIKTLFRQKNDHSYYFNCFFDKQYNDLYFRKKSIIRQNVENLTKKLKRKKLEELFKNQGKVNYLPKQFSLNEKKILINLKYLLAKKTKKYILILTPIKNNYKLNQKDYDFLSAIFSKNLIDASGNNFFTKNNSLFIDDIHYVPFVNEIIMDSVKNKFYK